MADLTDLSSVSGNDLSESQVKGILAQIDLDITNLVRDGKLSALRYELAGKQGQALTDRASNLKALLQARTLYEKILKNMPSWEISRHEDHDRDCVS